MGKPVGSRWVENVRCDDCGKIGRCKQTIGTDADGEPLVVNICEKCDKEWDEEKRNS